MSPWLLLFCAIAAELVGTTALKASEGFKRPLPSLAVIVFYGLAFFLFSQSLGGIPLGTAYAVWSGVGVAATALIGMIVFRERLTWPRAAGMGLVVVGVVALNLAGGEASP
jgi:small multidrug resistance pump